MEDMRPLHRHLDRLYAELAELRRYVVTHLPVERTHDQRAWHDLVKASEEISALWTGPGAVEEIRAQREK